MKYLGKKVLLIDGGSRQVLPMIKGFHNLGFEVSVFCGSKFDVGYNFKYTDKKILAFYDAANHDKTYESILKAVKRKKYDIIVPMNDFAATILSEHKKNFSRYCECVYVNDYDKFLMAADKMNTMRVCMSNEIPCPKTIESNQLEDVDVEQLSFPVVVKPRIGYGANGFNIVDRKEELELVFKKVKKKFGSVFVQEFIPKGGGQYQAEMVMDTNGELKSFLLMDKIRWYPIDGGSSTLNKTIYDEEIKNSCVRLLQKIGWVGYASLDLIRDPRDGIAKIMEINPRINGTVKLCFFAGIDVSRQISEYAFEESITPYLCYKEGLFLHYIHMDILRILKTKNKLKELCACFDFKNSVDEIFYREDIRPFVFYSFTSIGKLINDKKKRSI